MYYPNQVQTLNIIYSDIHKEPNLGSKPHKIDLTSCAISQLLCIKSVSCIGLLHVKFLQVWNWLILISRFSRLQFLSGVVVILCTVLAQLCVFLISVSLQPSLKADRVVPLDPVYFHVRRFRSVTNGLNDSGHRLHSFILSNYRSIYTNKNCSKNA